VDETHDVGEGLGKVNESSSAGKFNDRNDADVRVRTVVTCNDECGGKRLASGRIESLGSVDEFAASAFDETKAVRGELSPDSSFLLVPKRQRYPLQDINASEGARERHRRSSGPQWWQCCDSY
jgi:hypothetical protein